METGPYYNGCYISGFNSNFLVFAVSTHHNRRDAEMIYVVKAIITYDLELTKLYLDNIAVYLLILFLGIGIFSAVMNTIS